MEHDRGILEDDKEIVGSAHGPGKIMKPKVITLSRQN